MRNDFRGVHFKFSHLRSHRNDRKYDVIAAARNEAGSNLKNSNLNKIASNVHKDTRSYDEKRSDVNR